METQGERRRSATYKTIGLILSLVLHAAIFYMVFRAGEPTTTEVVAVNMVEEHSK